MLKKVRVVGNIMGAGLLVTVLSAGTASALEPEHEVRRLMLATESAVGSENWNAASEYLNRLQQMDAEKPADYQYFRGRVMLESGHYNEARSALEAYVSAAGAEGDHYTRALELITRVETSRQKERAGGEQSGSAGEEPVAVIEPAGEASLENLRELYLADSDAEALVIHLNVLLDRAGWRPSERVKRLDRPAHLSYQINRMNDSLNIQESRRDDNERVTRSTESLGVFGVNPTINWNCEPAASACYLYDPRDGSRLMQLGEDQGVASEVARTLGQLIRVMQNQG